MENTKRRLADLESAQPATNQRPFSHDLINALLTGTTPAGYTAAEWQAAQRQTARMFNFAAIDATLAPGSRAHEH